MSYNSVNFDSEVKFNTKAFSRKQSVKLAWLCAVRVLPFIGLEKKLNYWMKDEKQKYLYSVFNVLDICSARYADAASYDASYASHYASSYASQFIESRYSNRVIVGDLSAGILSYIEAVLSSALSSAKYAARHADSARYAAQSAVSYAILSAGAVSHTARYAGDFNIVLHSIVDKFQEIIMQDIDNVKNNKKIQNNSIEFYGFIWDNFEKVLNNEGCNYWSKLYKRLFENHLDVDIKELEKRLNLPNEIRGLGINEVARYLEDIDTYGSENLNEARLIILGDKGAGKTSITRRLINPNAKMPTNNESTPGVDTHIWEFDDVNVHIWDFAGHTVTHAVHKFFLSERCFYIIVYNGRYNDKNPTENIRYWLDHIKNYGGNSKVLILINQHDENRVSIEINNLKEDFEFIIDEGYQFSIQDDLSQLHLFRNFVKKEIKRNLTWEKNLVPANLYKVKEALESIFIKDNKEHAQELITIKEVKEIAKKLEVDDYDELCKRLHTLGVCLWYRDLDDYNTLILNPEWVSYGVYTVINWMYNNYKYKIKIEEFKDAFANELTRFPVSKHDLIFDLMQKYELAYKIRNLKELVIPHILPKDKPDSLPTFSLDGGLLAKYTANHKLPPNTISRFIVRHSNEILRENNKDIVWRSGVVLFDGKGSTALVREKEREISISVKGKDKTSYYNRLVLTMDDIFNSYKTQKPELSVSVNRFGPIPEIQSGEQPRYKTIKEIKSANSNNIPLYDYETGQILLIEKIIREYAIEVPVINNRVDFSQHNSSSTNDYFQQNQEIQQKLNELLTEMARASKFGNVSEINRKIELLKTYEKIRPEDIPEDEKKGFVTKIRNFARDISDETSNSYRGVEGADKIINSISPIIDGFASRISKTIYED